MKVHVLQHVPFEGIGSMARWTEAHNVELSYSRFFEDPTLPCLDGLDLIIAMGGPMSVNDEATLPWLVPEKQFIREAVTRGLPVLGICLGAQLIASALGSRIYANTQREIGWFPIEATPGVADVFRFPAQCTVFHWHGETFDLPTGAIRLARSAACENQAFQVGERVIGLQFHLETTRENISTLVENCRDELVAGPYIQTESALQQISSALLAENQSLLDKILTYITREKG